MVDPGFSEPPEVIEGGQLRCLQCGTALQAPTGGGRAPRFCSPAHRAKYNRDHARALAGRVEPSTPPDATRVLRRFDAALGELGSAGRSLRELAEGFHPQRAADRVARLETTLAALRDELNDAHVERDAARRELELARAALGAETQLRQALTEEVQRLRPGTS